MSDQPLGRVWQEEEYQERHRQAVASQGEGEVLDGQQHAEAGVEENAQTNGQLVDAGDRSSQLDGAHLAEEDDRNHFPETLGEALEEPGRHQGREGGGHVDEDVAEAGEGVADDEDLLPANVMADRNAAEDSKTLGQWSDGHVPGVSVSTQLYSTAIQLVCGSSPTAHNFPTKKCSFNFGFFFPKGKAPRGKSSFT